MRRREFMMLVTSAAVVRPGAAAAQATALPIVGYLGSGVRFSSPYQFDAFRKGLTEGGFVEGSNLVIEQQWAQAV